MTSCAEYTSIEDVTAERITFPARQTTPMINFSAYKKPKPALRVVA